jgi:hypothetical protein
MKESRTKGLENDYKNLGIKEHGLVVGNCKEQK